VTGPGRPEAAVRDDVDLFGWPEQTLGCRHMPVGEVRAGVVVCLPTALESAVDDGRSARLGRRLARAGIAVQRYHHRGAPESDGDPRSITFASLVADAHRAGDLLYERTGVERVGYLGVRLGALVAARAARTHPGVPIALWEPVVDPRHAVEQAAAARAAVRAAAAAAVPAPSPDGAAPAPADGAPGDDGVADLVPLDLFDTQLCADLMYGGAVGSLPIELGAGPGPVLVVQTSEGAVRPAYRAVGDECRAHGRAVEVVRRPCDASRHGIVVPGGPADGLVEATASWFETHLLAAGG
jgi:hypothetical protein